MTRTAPSAHEFNTAGGSVSAGGDTAAIIVDVQLGCVKYMSREDCRNYLSALGETIEDLRANQIPVNWVVMGRNDGLVRPETDKASNEVRPRGELARMGFMNPDPFNAGDMAKDNEDIFEEFIMAHGPRGNEAVFVKDNYFSAFDSDAFTQHLQSNGIKNTVTMGLVGSVCAFETSIGGTQRGFITNLLLDHVATWAGEGRDSQLIWREGFNSPEEANTWQRAEMNLALDKPHRGFTDEQRQAAKQINYTTYNDFTSSALAPSASPPSPPPPRSP